MKLIASNDDYVLASGQNTLEMANDADPSEVSLEGVERVQLHFPKFSDGRAFSQAFLLRRRLGFQGQIFATGDVLVDQLAQMKRSGFDVAVLRADQPLDVAHRVLAAYPGYGVGKYQGDAVDTRPHFVNPSPVTALAA